MGLLGLTALCIALTSTPYLLLPTQVLLGLGFVGTITITMAYIADVAALQERSLAIGLAATMMGLGYATGTLLGGAVAGGWGYVNAYLVAALLALAGFVMAWLGLPGSRPEVRFTERSRLSLGQQFRAMAGNSQILAVSWGGLLMFLVFGGLVITFFPIYAHGLGISQATLGFMLAVRALASTLARLPGGALATKLPGQWILLAAMVIAAVFAFVLPQLKDPALLTGLLLSEGVAYGLYLTIGQTLITEYADEASRGAALGMYSTATSIGGSLLPFFLGVVADLSGLTTIFYLTGGLLALGIIFMIRVSLQPQAVSSMLKGGS
jgi:MFS family permease